MKDIEALLPKSSERILILGATGWFGKTALDLFKFSKASVLTSSQKVHPATDSSKAAELDAERRQIEDFSPTYILDFSFLTKETLKSIDLVEFKATNELLTDRLLSLSLLSSVKRIMYVSSGAAIHPADALEVGFEINPYGFLKRCAETKLEQLVKSSDGRKSVSILRPWSVSGKHVRNSSNYLFSSLVSQAVEGRIRLKTQQPVYRRYVSVQDALLMGLSIFREGEVSLLDTGGDLIEAQELAAIVKQVVNPSAELLLPKYASQESDNYFSDNISWLDILEKTHHKPLSLVQQVQTYADSLRQT
jgi:nucleoside-diphosphate-sugar epimerase